MAEVVHEQYGRASVKTMTYGELVGYMRLMTGKETLMVVEYQGEGVKAALEAGILQIEGREEVDGWAPGKVRWLWGLVQEALQEALEIPPA